MTSEHLTATRPDPRSSTRRRTASRTLTLTASLAAAAGLAAGPAVTWADATASAGTTAGTTGFNPLTWDYAANAGRHSSATTHPITTATTLRTAGQQFSDVTTAKGSTAILYDNAADAVVRQSSLGAGLKVNAVPGARLIVANNTIDVLGNSLTGQAMTVQNCTITSTNDGIDPVGTPTAPATLIEYNQILRDGTRVGTNHHDGIQFWQGGNTVIRRNWISGWQTSALMIKSDKATISHVTIDENYLANPTGYFTTYVRDGGYGHPTYITITNNTFGKGSPISTGATTATSAKFVRTQAERDRAVTNHVPGAASWIVWANNVDTTGHQLTPPGGWITYP